MKKLKVIMLLVGLSLGHYLSAQNNPGYYTDSDSQTGNITTATSLSVAINKPVASGLRETPYSAKLYVELAFEDDYISTGEQFTYQLTFDVTIASQASTPHTFTISETNPRAMLVLDVLPNVASLSSGSIVVSIPTILGNPLLTTSGTITPNYIQNKLQFKSTIVREYQVDVRNTSGGITNGPVSTQVAIPALGRRANFTWAAPIGVTTYPNYELQILRLYNTDPSLQNSTTAIKVEVDWSKAMRVETQSSTTGIDLTLAEGTGFYIWRVRPIGNYFEGGIANSENYGKWSNSYADGSTPTIQLSSIGGANAGSYGNTFYFNDPDEDINWIYNRVFTEANQEGNSGVKTSEGMSYADGLLRARQTQAYNSSNNTTLVTQTISDYSGRPALTTLPVPVNGDLENYRVGFVQNGNGDVYTAFDYDDGALIEDPTQINNANFDYYSGNSSVVNNDNVADAEGFPFKRTIFKTDGTGRVTEESGVGKVHALGTIGGTGGGKTTRILFGSASDEELIRIFGEEAPLAESVIKTITIDPNDVISVTYTSKEGKTIATALITEQTNNLEDLDESLTPLTAKNVANQNVLSNQKFISSKRIAVELSSKTITLTYEVIDGVTMPACPGGECNLKVRFFLTDLQTGKTYISDNIDPVNDPTNDILGDAFDLPGSSLTFPSGWSWIDQDAIGGSAPSTLFPISGVASNEFTLTEGEYIITKEVFSANEPNFAEAYAVQYGANVQEVIEAIGVKMEEITDAQGYTAFENFITQLKSLVDAYQALSTTNPYTTAAQLTASNDLVTHLGIVGVDVLTNTNVGDPNTYWFPVEFSFTDENGDPITDPMIPDPNNPDQDVLSFGLSCCGTLDIPVPKPEICVPCEAVGNIDEMRENHKNDNYFIDGSGTPQQGWSLVSGIVEDYFMDYLYNRLDEQKFITAYDPNNPSIYNPGADNDLQPVIDRFAPGFNHTTLNQMLTNMLVSRYYLGQSKYNSADQKYYRAKENDFGWLFFTDNNDDFITPGVKSLDFNTKGDYDIYPEIGVGTEVTGINDNDEFNYDCKKLYECWIQAVNLINAFEFGDDTNVMNSANDEDGANTSEDHYDDDDSSDGPGGVVGWVASFIISEKMRDFQENEADIPPSRLESMVSLPNVLLDCAGFQYAGIIDEDVSTSAPDYSNTSSYNGGSPKLFSYDKTSLGVDEFTFVPNTCSSTNPETEVKQSTLFPSPVVGKLYYPYITKPEWMFKYFRYNAYDGYTSSNVVNDEDKLLVNQFDLEVAACYNDPYGSCPNTNLSPCFGEECRYTHYSWSSGQRLNFYKQIRGGLTCPPDNPQPIVPEPLPVYTKEELIGFANYELDQAEDICNSRAGSIKAALINELYNKCYEFVDCKTSELPIYQISEDQVDNMVEAVVASCIAEIDAIRMELPSINATTTLCEDNPLATNPALGYGCNLDINNELNSEYPYYFIQQCNWINVSGVCEQDDQISLHLFPDCHQAILTQITQWSFDPNIDPAPDNPDLTCVPSTDKEWTEPTYCTSASCSTLNCTHDDPDGTTYSTIKPITNP